MIIEYNYIAIFSTFIQQNYKYYRQGKYLIDWPKLSSKKIFFCHRQITIESNYRGTEIKTGHDDKMKLISFPPRF